MDGVPNTDDAGAPNPVFGFCLNNPPKNTERKTHDSLYAIVSIIFYFNPYFNSN